MFCLRKIAPIAVIGAFLFCGKALAQTTNWIGAGGVWNDGANWDNDVPVPGGTASFNVAGSISTSIDSTISVANLTIGSSSGDLQITDAEGSLAVTSAITNESSNIVQVSMGITGTPTLTVGGGGIMDFEEENFDIGAVHLDSGTINVFGGAEWNATVLVEGESSGQNGTLVVDGSVDIPGTVYAGESNGSAGTITVESEGEMTAGALAIGYFGNGVLQVNLGGTLTSGGDVLGVESGSDGQAFVDGGGSSWTDTSLIIGYNGTGSVTLSDGGTLTVAPGALSLGASFGGVGTLNIGAAATGEAVAPGILDVGSLTGGNGSVVQFNMTTEDPYYFSTDGTAEGTPIVMNGRMGVILNNGLLVLNAQSGYTGGTTVNDGTLGLGSSTIGTPGNISSGPIGTGPLTFTNDDAELIPYFPNITLANDIVLNTDGQVTFGEEDTWNLTLSGTISGSGGIDVNQNAALILTGANTYHGGTEVDNGELILGSSTNGNPGSFTSGPIGTGTLTLEDGVSVGLNGADVTLANDIFFDSDGDTLRFADEDSHNLTLLGSLTGTGGIYWGSSGTLELNGANTFTGGVEVGAGTLRLDNSTVTDGDILSGPAGVGTLYFDPGSTLTIPEGSNITIANNIVIKDTSDHSTTMTIGGYSTGSLTLSGTISDNEQLGGSIIINSPVTITANNTYSGGTNINNTFVTVTKDQGLGYGAVVASGSEITFTSQSPYISSGDFESDTTVNFTVDGGSPELGGLYMHNSTIMFADNSSPYIDNLSSDLPGDESQIILGNNTSLTFDDVSDPDFYGNISGGGNVTYYSGENVEYNIYGFNSYTGGTYVTGNAILVAGSNSAFGDPSGTVTVSTYGAIATLAGVTITNPIQMADQGYIYGFGTFSPAVASDITIGSGTIIAGGTGSSTLNAGGGPLGSVGTLSFGANDTIFFTPGGILQFSIMNPTGTAGTDFSQITAAGNLDLSALSSSDFFTIQPVSIDPGTGLPGMANFTNTSSYSWVLISAAGGISPFDPSDFVVDLSHFGNSVGAGQFYVSESGDDTQLLLNFSPVPEPSTKALIAGGTAMMGLVALRRRRPRAA